jgi:hypothetical protein
LADDHPAPDLKANIEDSTPQNKLGFNKLASPEFRDPKKPIPLPGAKWFD